MGVCQVVSSAFNNQAAGEVVKHAFAADACWLQGGFIQYHGEYRELEWADRVEEWPAQRVAILIEVELLA